MHSCPNCGRATARTEDWACQWCGYPLLSGSYKRIPKTYKQLREEELREQKPPEPELVLESEPETELEPECEPMLEPEPEPEPELEPEHEVILEPEPILESEPELVLEPEPEPEPIPEPEAELEPEVEPGLQPEPELPAGVMKVTVEELNSAYRADKVAADAKFRDKILRVTGVVDRVVVKYHLNIHYIILASAGGAGEWNVRCEFERENSSELNRLSVGQTVMVQGKYNGYARNIIMQDCVLVR